MKKLALGLIIALLVFVLTLIGAMAATGNLSKEAIGKLLKRGAAGEKTPLPQTEREIAPWVEELKKREEDLRKLEAIVAEKEKRLQISQVELEQMQNDLQNLLKQVGATMEAGSENLQQNLQNTAKALEGMKSDKAAETLEGLPEDMAAKIIPLISEKKLGKILDDMDESKRIRLLGSPLETGF